MTRFNNFLIHSTKRASWVTKKILPKIIEVQNEKTIFNHVAKRIRKQVLIYGKENNQLAFCIVHWNAPDYLLLNVRQIQLLYPQSNIYVLDNGSQQANLDVAKRGLASFRNVTLFSAKLQSENLAERLLSEGLFNSYTHSKALQFLFDYCEEKSNETAVFLDHDCILLNNIDYLLDKFGKDVVLIGARDCVVAPKNYGLLKKGTLRDHGKHIHASFMILQPKRIKQLLGNFSFFNAQKCVSEPYHEISLRTQGKILFLETQMHETIPFLTRYMHQNITYAWHAWYTSRTAGLPLQTKLDNFPVSWLHEVRKLAFDYLQESVYN